MNRLTLRAVLMVTCMALVGGMHAQSVDFKKYYAGANGKKKAELKTAMYNIIGNPNVKSYSSLWTYYYQTDRLSDNQVVDRYSNEKHYFSGPGDEPSGMNKEHGIANSWWGKTKNATYSDLHHVMPSETNANSRKSNYGMGVVTSQTWTNGSIKVGKGTAGNNGIVQLWEPADEWKGDFARIYFYIVTCYEELSMVQTEGANTMQTNTYPKLQPWAYQLYLKWAKEDPVSELERQRNEAVYKIQGNRNPFIDYPSLAEYIWGDSITYAFDVSLPHGNDGDVTPGPGPDPTPDPDPQPIIDPNAESCSIELNDLTWTSTTDATYGPGFTATTNGLTLSYYKDKSATTPVIVAQYSQLRFYDQSVFVIEGAEIVGVTFYDAGGSKSDCSISIDGKEYAFDDGKLTWTGSMQPFFCRANKQSRIKSIDIAVASPKQLPYYYPVQGLNQSALKNALHDIIQPTTVLSYGGGDGHTWEGFAAIDTTSAGYVRDRYSNYQRRFSGNNAVAGMNIEHIWANSWWGHTVNNAYCDLFNLYPADGEANGRKNNNPIGIVDQTIAFDNGVTKVGKSTSYRADSLITVWEPADQWKGDFARTYFYMATAYQHMTSEWTTSDGLLTIDPSSWQTMRPWVSQLMLDWAAQDPVDSIEIRRNEAIYEIQGNRNPYVDWPELADYVWGSRVGEVFYIDPEETTPELFVPAEDATVNFGLQALSLGLHHTLVVRGRNMTGGLTATIEGEGFAMEDAQLTAEEVQAGSLLSITSTAQEPGAYEATLILQGENGFVRHTHLHMTMIDGIPAYAARDIVCGVYKKQFTASWMNMQLAEGQSYMIDVFTVDAEGNATSLEGYPLELTDTFAVVTGVKAATTYFYRVTIPGTQLTSYEVEVEMPEVTPIFSVNAKELYFSAQPYKASQAQQLTITATATKSTQITVTCPAPFEVSADGEEWTSGQLTLTGRSVPFFVRCGAVSEEGRYEDELTISTEGVRDIILPLSAAIDVTMAFLETFEAATKGGYSVGDITGNAAQWTLDNALLGADNNRCDNKSVRMKSGGSITMLEDKPAGCDSLWFYAGLYNQDTGVLLTVSYSLDGGLSWTPVVEDLAFTKGEWKRYGYELRQSGDIRLMFEATGTKDKRINIDNVQMSDYTTAVLALGDVNGDGAVDLTDAIMIVYYSLGQEQTDFNEEGADMNDDGIIDLTDAIMVVYKSLEN